MQAVAYAVLRSDTAGEIMIFEKKTWTSYFDIFTSFIMLTIDYINFQKTVMHVNHCL